MKRCLIFLIIALLTPSILPADLKPPEQGYIQSYDAQIYYKRIGEGFPIIIIHGGPGHNSSYLTSEFEALAQNNELIFYDQRGTGASCDNLNFNQVTLPQFVQDLENLRKELKLNKFILMSHGWGSTIATEYAHQYPKNVTQIVLIDPLPASSQDLTSFASELSHRFKDSKNPAESITKSEAFISGDLPTYKKFYAHFFKEFFYEEENLSKLHFKIDQKDALQGFLVYRIFEESLLKGGYDFKEHLKKISAKTLVIHGDSDPIPLWTAQELASLIPNSKCRIIKDCGHFPHIEKPDELFDEIQLFLKDTP